MITQKQAPLWSFPRSVKLTNVISFLFDLLCKEYKIRT